MHKYLAIFLIFFMSGSVMAEEENVPAYGDDDFIGFIHDSLVGSVFEDWEILYMEGYIGLKESGEADGKASYFYKSDSPYGDVQIFVSDSAAMLSAISYIRKNAQDRGETWNSFRLEFFPDHTHSLTTW